jgi:hypothetical protein
MFSIFFFISLNIPVQTLYFSLDLFFLFFSLNVFIELHNQLTKIIEAIQFSSIELTIEDNNKIIQSGCGGREQKKKCILIMFNEKNH